jgi:hypothetical protein
MSRTGGVTHHIAEENCKRDTNVTQKGRGSNKRNRKLSAKHTQNLTKNQS